MRVRRATRNDFEAIYRVAKDSWETDYPDVLNRENVDEAVDEWYRSDEFVNELDRPRSVVLVAEDEDETGGDGDVVGFSHAVWKGAAGYILRLYVAPGRRRDGFGRALLDRTREELRRREVDEIQAMVLSANAPGNAFYEAFGFERVDEGETVIGGEHFPETRYRIGLD